MDSYSGFDVTKTGFVLFLFFHLTMGQSSISIHIQYCYPKPSRLHWLASSNVNAWYKRQYHSDSIQRHIIPECESVVFVGCDDCVVAASASAVSSRYA